MAFSTVFVALCDFAKVIAASSVTTIVKDFIAFMTNIPDQRNGNRRFPSNDRHRNLTEPAASVYELTSRFSSRHFLAECCPPRHPAACRALQTTA